MIISVGTSFTRFTFLSLSEGSSGMIIRSESCKFALRENLLTLFSHHDLLLLSTLPIRAYSIYVFPRSPLCPLASSHSIPFLFPPLSFFLLPREQRRWRQRRRRRYTSPGKSFEADSFVNRHYYRNWILVSPGNNAFASCANDNGIKSVGI